MFDFVLLSRINSLQPVDCNSPGIFQARILEWVSISFSSISSPPSDPAHVSCISCIDRWILYQDCHLGSLMFDFGDSLIRSLYKNQKPYHWSWSRFYVFNEKESYILLETNQIVYCFIFIVASKNIKCFM